jgi:hypothetical protein
LDDHWGFNEILFSHEKEGGNPQPQGFMNAFRDVLMECGLEDLGYSGDIFTWKRGWIRERLDRVVVNGAWSVMHPTTGVQHLEYIKSEHRPILLETEIQQHAPRNQSKSKCFKARWLQEKGFQEKVQQTWEVMTAVSPLDNVLSKLNKLHGALHEWDANILQRSKHHMKKAQQELEKAMAVPMTDENETLA